MTQQEQQRDVVPGPRAGEHDEDEVAVGTAPAPHEAGPATAAEVEDARYPGRTYASDSSEADATDGERDEAFAAEESAATGEATAAWDATAEDDEDHQDHQDYQDYQDYQDQEDDEGDEEATARVEEAEDAHWGEEHERADDTTAVEVVDSTESLPGAVESAPAGAIWAGGAVDGLRERWRELQLRFIDDPRAVAGEADALVTEAVAGVTRSLEDQRRRLAAWQDEPGDDTERLRAAVRGYRDFLDRVLGL